MTTQTIVVTKAPQQISDGKKALFMQEKIGSGAMFSCQSSKPTNLDDYFVLRDGEATVGDGFPLWVWKAHDLTLILTVVKAE